MLIVRGDRKRPNGLTLVPWQSVCSLTSDVTVVDTLASSYTPTASMTLCGAAEAALRERAIYADIKLPILVPIAIETLGQIKMNGQRFLTESANAFRQFPMIQDKPYSCTRECLR